RIIDDLRKHCSALRGRPMYHRQRQRQGVNLDTLGVHSPKSLLEIPIGDVQWRTHRTLDQHRCIAIGEIDIKPRCRAVRGEIVEKRAREIVRVHVNGATTGGVLLKQYCAERSTDECSAVHHRLCSVKTDIQMLLRPACHSARFEYGLTE